MSGSNLVATLLSFIKKYYSAFISLALVAFVCVRMGPVWLNSYNQKGTELAQVVGTDITNKPIQIPMLNKKAVYIFWTTWCGPCHYQMDLFKKAVASGKIEKDEIIAVNLGEDVATVENFQKSKEYPFQILIAPPQFSWKTFKVMVTPTIAYITEKGEVANFTSGLSPLAVFRSQRFLN